MKTIPLSQGKVAMVDDEDYEYLIRWKWYASRGHSGIFYAARNNHPDSPLKMHRFILQLEKGDRAVDHKDGDGLNNQKNNLRICSNAENVRNKRISPKNTSGYKGVCFEKQTGKWKAQITVNYDHHNLGRFSTKELAYQSYCEAAKRLHGEFARV